MASDQTSPCNDDNKTTTNGGDTASFVKEMETEVKHNSGKKHGKYSNALKVLLPVRVHKSRSYWKDFPFHGVGFFSFITYHWMNKLMWKSYRKGLDIEDLWTCGNQDSADTGRERLQKMWQEELDRRGPENASLGKVMFKFCRTRLIPACLALIICTTFGFLGPAVFVRLLLDYIQSLDSTLGYGIALAFGLIINELLRVLSMAAVWAVSVVTAVRLRGAVLSMLFHKILRLRSLKNKSVGDLVNLCANDGQRIYDVACWGPLIVGGPYAAIAGMIYIIYIIGYWGLLACGIFIVFYPFQISLSKLTEKIRRKCIGITDKRVRLMSEVLASVKLIKMYAWEKSFAKAIAAIRRSERIELEKAAYVQSVSISSAVIVPVLAGTVTFIGYTLTGNELTPTVAFTVIGVLNSTRFAIGSLPYAIKSLAEGAVVVVRIKAFVMLPLFRVMGFALRTIPNIVQSYASARVGIDRFKEVLLMEEHKGIDHVLQDTSNAVELQNVTLAWDAQSIAANAGSNVNKKPSKPIQIRSNSKSWLGIKEDFSLHRPVSKENFETPSSRKSITDDTDETTMLKNETDDDNSSSQFILTLLSIDLNVKKGTLIGICGSVGSGKSSLVQALLGQMTIMSGRLAVNGSIAYVSQQAWILNATVKDNILFNLPDDTKRYQAVVKACGLEHDLELFPAGDQTEIGERGINVSGGQKQRISLARAVYSDKDIYLLDDPLSAVDTHVGEHIFTQCIKQAMSGKTVVFVTHQLQYLNNCDDIIVMKEGRIAEHGNHAELMKQEGEYCYLIKSFHESDNSEAAADLDHKLQEASSPSARHKAFNKQASHISCLSRGLSRTSYISSTTSLATEEVELTDPAKLIEAEEINTGAISWSAYKNYFMACGGPCVVFVVFFFNLITIITTAFNNWWLSYWLSQDVSNVTVGNMTFNTSVIDNPDLDFYTLIYGLSILTMVILTTIRGILYVKATLKGSSRFHDDVFKKVFSCPMKFFDVTPSGRILNRFSKDLDEIDVRMPFQLETFLQNILIVLSSLVMIALVFPWFLMAVIPLCIIFVFVTQCFRAGVRELKRIDNVTRSPLFSHIAAGVQGLSTIGAYGMREEFLKRFNELLDINTMSFLLFNFAMRWSAVRLDCLTFVITGVTAFLCVLTPPDVLAPAFAGLALSYAIQLTGLFQFTMRNMIETEARFTSAERISDYIQNLESEGPFIVENNRPAIDWPSEGRIEFDSISMRYRPGLPLVLKNLTCSIKAKEKIGIVGRTGSGKSSLGVVLFRLVDPSSGKIIVDGIDTRSIGLEDLRSALSIIPQEPVLFVGTVRYNLDPFHQHNDDKLWTALEKCHIKDMVQSLDTQLDAPVVENGENFSVGERQLICMARALLRNSKILMLDEATAAIDTETDSLIQATIKEAFAECTTLTIAHRLNTVLNCDRIMVLKEGQIAEFDRPSTLLANPKSLFSSMMAAANDQKRAATSTLYE